MARRKKSPCSKRRPKTVAVKPHSRSPRGKGDAGRPRPSVKPYKRRTPC